MKRPSLPYLLLLPLLAVLVFGNCGGGVNSFLYRLDYAAKPQRQQRLATILKQRKQQRASANQQLSGKARREELRRIEATSNGRLDSLLRPGYERTKFKHRRHKIERRLQEQPGY